MLRAGNVTASTVDVANAGGFVSDPVLAFFLERYTTAYRAELDAFIAAVAHGAAPLPDGEDGLRALLLADAAAESARTGATIHLA
jgi:myo-inositol 2-dehydrogenase/D-chiro-inositol 1-dehydrogenase